MKWKYNTIYDLYIVKIKPDKSSLIHKLELKYVFIIWFRDFNSKYNNNEKQSFIIIIVYSFWDTN